jgi:hypothetical protein
MSDSIIAKATKQLACIARIAGALLGGFATAPAYSGDLYGYRDGMFDFSQEIGITATVGVSIASLIFAFGCGNGPNARGS